MTPLTIESLAQALHEDSQAACIRVHGKGEWDRWAATGNPMALPWESLVEKNKEVRREFARLVFQRIMR